MLVFAADDERYALINLTKQIKEALPEACVMSFNSGFELLDELNAGSLPDIAFLDIKMRDMTGLELSVKIKEKSPYTNIVFVTAYSKYAYDAMKMRASGYVLKPVTKKAVLEELEHLRNPVEALQTQKVKIKCFGHFEIYAADKPLKFKRKRSKELLAYLVDRRGAGVSTDELCAVLYEDDFPTPSVKTQFRTLVAELRHTLEEAGISEVLVRSRNNFSVDTSKIDCDYYRMLNNDVEAINSYCGEYMSQYTWSELTLGGLELRR